MKIFFLSLTILISTSLHAGVQTQESCTDLDIRETNPNIRDNPRLREHFSSPTNQDSVGWCYAFVAADLLSAEVQAPVSALHVSALFNRNTQTNPILRRIEERRRRADSDLSFQTVFEGGFTDKAIELVSRNRAICPEDLLPFDSNHARETRDFIRGLEELKRAETTLDPADKVCRAVVQYLPGIDGLSTASVEISTNLLSTNLNISLEEMARQQCQNNMIPVPPLRAKYMNPGKNPQSRKFANFLAKINEKISNGRPVGLSYDVKNYVKNQEGSHASVITGRRWRNGQCEYKIRNSWGQSCASYKDGIDCNREEGSFWVSDESFASSDTSIEYIDS